MTITSRYQKEASFHIGYALSKKYFGHSKNPNYYLPKRNKTPDDAQSKAHTIKTKPPLIDVEAKRVSERERRLPL